MHATAHETYTIYSHAISTYQLARCVHRGKIRRIQLYHLSWNILPYCFIIVSFMWTTQKISFCPVLRKFFLQTTFVSKKAKNFRTKGFRTYRTHTRHLCSSLTGDIFWGPDRLPYRRMDCGCVSGRVVRRRSGTAVEPVCTADHFFGKGRVRKY